MTHRHNTTPGGGGGRAQRHGGVTHRSRWLVQALLALCGAAIIMSACGGGGGGETDLADDILERCGVSGCADSAPENTTTPPGDTSDTTESDVDPDQCEIISMTDQYGEPIEVEACGADIALVKAEAEANANTAPSEPGRASSELVGPSAVALLESVAVTMVDNSACTPPSVDMSSITVEAVSELLTAAIGELELAATSCAAGDVGPWAEHLGEAVGHLDHLASLVDGQPILALPDLSSGPSDAALGDLTARAVSVNDRLFEIADENRFATFATRTWFSADHLGHSQLLRDHAANNTSPELVILGNSAAEYALDPAAIAEATDLRTFNAAMSSAGPEVTARWFDEISALAAPAHVVLAYPADTFVCINYTEPDQQTWERGLDPFAAAPGLDGLDRYDRLLGTTDGEGYPVSAPALDAYIDEHSTDGDGAVKTRPAEAQLADDAVAPVWLVSRYDSGTLCEPRYDALASLLSDLAPVTESVSLVVLPVSERTLAVSDRAPELVQQATDRLQATAEAGGAQFINGAGSPAAEDFWDFFHTNETGRDKVMTAVLAELPIG